MADDRKARRAARLLTTQAMVDEFLAGIADEDLRAETLEQIKPFLKFEYRKPGTNNVGTDEHT